MRQTTKKQTASKQTVTVAVMMVVFGLGLSIGSFAGKKAGVTSAAWSGVAPEAAAANLLDVARDLAEDGSWENINLARVHYLLGEKDEAEAILDKYRDGKEAGDLIRIARIYAHAEEWDKAKPLFDRVVELEPKDEDWLIEVGAFYNLNGDRETAEQLFARGFKSAPRNLKNALTAAGSYVGVFPRRR